MARKKGKQFKKLNFFQEIPDTRRNFSNHCGYEKNGKKMFNQLFQKLEI